jgi:PTH1 family peptidyl-tRNA hydrolase
VIVVGLGNPGRKYEETRHNAGFLVLGVASRRWRAGTWRKHALYEENTVSLGGRQHTLIRPLTYMNCSGEAVGQLLKGGADPADLMVILDDVDLPLGRIRLRPQGGAGGHRGLQSILEVLSPASIARMRIGVGRPTEAGEVVDHVLGAFASEERVQFAQMLERAVDALQVVFRSGIEPAMNRFNGLPAPWEASAGEEGDGTSAEVREEEN